jgi:hypothetical protein
MLIDEILGLSRTNDVLKRAVLLSLSKHVGKGLSARPFDKLRVTGLFRMHYVMNNA